MSQWQPFETAPRDGTPILVYDTTCCKGEKIFVVMYEHDKWELVGQFFYESYERAGFIKPFEPTHWHPLPNIPHEL